MKIVILDGYTENPGDLSWSALEKLGDLTVYPRTSAHKVIERIGDAEIVLTNKTPITAKTINAVQNLKYIGVLATGYNVVDVESAKKKNITITNIPTYGTAAVGQFAIALLLEICHHIGHHNSEVHRGKWENCPDWCFWDYPLIELAGKTMGIIGFGRIGRVTGKIAKSLGMNILAVDSFETAEGKEIASYVDLDVLLKDSDVIVLHCPLLPSTEGIINNTNIAKMKEDVIIINNSRGPLIVEQDLADALNNGKVFAAGLDVVSQEPINSDNPLLQAKNCFITPHISWASKESRERLLNIAVTNLSSFLNGKPINTIQ